MAEPKVDTSFNFRLWRYDGEPGELIPLLQAAQDHYGYIPEHAIEQISAATGYQPAKIYGVITFYNQFRLQPMGKHVIRMCQGTACHVAGAKTLLEVVEDELGIHEGETDKDGLFTLSCVACIGCCSLAPVMMINEDTFGKLDPKKIRATLRKIRRESQSGKPRARPAAAAAQPVPAAQ
jgi:NADH-quinone oxidoreductase subunit E